MERRVYRYETVGSTNTELMALARQGAAEGTVVLAGQQTAGRGRMGRSFQSPAGLGLYGSVLLRSSPEDAPRIPALAATAVRRAIRRSCGLSCGIKWPNDLVLSGRKVCGILAEALPGPEGSLWVVVGIGINVCQRREDFLPELRETAASLSMIAGAEIDRAALETAFLEELEALRRELPPHPETDIFRMVLTGETEEPPRLDALYDALSPDCFYLELQDRTTRCRDLWEHCGEDTLRGLFLRDLRQRYDAAPEEEKPRLLQAARFGLAALENREL